MAIQNRSIFRERAIEKYIRRQELQVILRLASPPTFIFLWTLLLLFLSACMLVWSIQVPTVISGEGMVIEQKASGGSVGQKIVLLLLLPPAQQAALRAGEPVSLHVGPANSDLNGAIDHVAAGIMSPANIRTQFNLSSPLAESVSGPSAVAIARVEALPRANTYVGSLGHVEVRIGSESALSLLPAMAGFPRQ